MAKSLPTVDISPYLTYPPSDTSTSTVSETNKSLSSALYNPGFFYLTNHGILSTTTDQILSLAREFFTAVPEEEKNEIRRLPAGLESNTVDGESGVNSVNGGVKASKGEDDSNAPQATQARRYGDGARGYQALRENITKGKRDGHEAIDWYRDVREGRSSNSYSAKEISKSGPPFELLQGPNLWPTNPPGFQDIYESYVKDMLELGTAVVRAIGHALNLQNPEIFVESTRESFWVMRAIGYPALSSSSSSEGKEEEEEEISCGEHTDYGCLTLLLMDETKKALQVKLPDQSLPDQDGKHGKEKWQDIEPVKRTYVVNVGDMVELWTGGKVRSTRHRVIHRHGGFRVSVPFFFEPDKDAMIEVLEEFREEGVEGKVVRYWDHLVGKIGGNFYGGGD